MPRRKSSAKKPEETNNIYEYETIITHRLRSDGTLEFFVKWKGYPDSENTWEPYSSFNTNTVNDYLAAPKNNESSDSEEDDDVDNLIPEEIIDIRRAGNSDDLVCLVKCKDRKDLHFIPTKIMNLRHTQMVIQFYERNIFWK